ncbi:MAG: hypothetical protein WKF37_02465 [Bryobacteraceae bacterium]
MLKPLLSGLAGACALTLTNELLRQSVPNAPRLEIAGMRGLAQLTRAAGYEPPAHLHQASLAGDLLSNSVCFSLAALGGAKHSVTAGALLGLGAGACAVLLPGKIGVGDGPTARTTETALLTLLYYTLGGVVAGAAYRAIARD